MSKWHKTGCVLCAQNCGLEVGEIIVGLADGLGLTPQIPDSLYQAAKGDRMKYGMELMNYAQSEPKAMKNMPFVLAKTLGREMGSVNLAVSRGGGVRE